MMIDNPHIVSYSLKKCSGANSCCLLNCNEFLINLNFFGPFLGELLRCGPFWTSQTAGSTVICLLHSKLLKQWNFSVCSFAAVKERDENHGWRAEGSALPSCLLGFTDNPACGVRVQMLTTGCYKNDDMLFML